MPAGKLTLSEAAPQAGWHSAVGSWGHAVWCVLNTHEAFCRCNATQRRQIPPCDRAGINMVRMETHQERKTTPQHPGQLEARGVLDDCRTKKAWKEREQSCSRPRCPMSSCISMPQTQEQHSPAQSGFPAQGPWAEGALWGCLAASRPSDPNHPQEISTVNQPCFWAV